MKNHKSTTRHHHSHLFRGLTLLGIAALLFALHHMVFPKKPFNFQEDATGTVSFPYQNAPEAISGLRGTVYDRNYKELAVSHLLYKVYCKPAEIQNPSEVASMLADTLGENLKSIGKKLHSPDNYLEISANVSHEQARLLADLHLPGISLEPYEIRYYPAQTTAAHALGYVHLGQGISGVEGRYDSILQPGVFSPADIPEIDFDSGSTPNEGQTDITLTLDIDIQKTMERLLHKYLHKKAAKQTMALILDPRNGSVYAMGSFPSYNPNCFWQSEDERRVNNLTEVTFSPALIKPLLEKAAESVAEDEPSGIATDNSVTSRTITGLLDRHRRHFDSDIRPAGEEDDTDGRDLLSGMELAVTAAGLINGGLLINPFILQSVYNHKLDHGFSRSPTYDQRMQRRIFSPADGVRIRRALSPYLYDKHNDFSLFTNSISHETTIDGTPRTMRQEILLGWSPNKFPQALVFIALVHDTTSAGDNKATGSESHEQPAIASLGDELLKLLHEACNRAYNAHHPGRRDPGNLDRLLASRRLDYQPAKTTDQKPESLMPELTGLSLRQGLRLLNKHHLPVKVQGSGRIVKQSPEAGVRLENVSECTLILDSNI